MAGDLPTWKREVIGSSSIPPTAKFLARAHFDSWSIRGSKFRALYVPTRNWNEFNLERVLGYRDLTRLGLGQTPAGTVLESARFSQFESVASEITESLPLWAIGTLRMRATRTMSSHI